MQIQKIQIPMTIAWIWYNQKKCILSLQILTWQYNRDNPWQYIIDIEWYLTVWCFILFHNLISIKMSASRLKLLELVTNRLRVTIIFIDQIHLSKLNTSTL